MGVVGNQDDILLIEETSLIFPLNPVIEQSGGPRIGDIKNNGQGLTAIQEKNGIALHLDFCHKVITKTC